MAIFSKVSEKEFIRESHPCQNR